MVPASIADTPQGMLSGNGSLLGRNSLGGAVNLVTRRGEGPINGEIELMGGTFGSTSAEASLGGTTGRGYDYYAGGGYNREDGWRQGTGADQWRASARRQSHTSDAEWQDGCVARVLRCRVARQHA